MAEVNKYRVFCTVEQTYVFGWGTSEPSVCPNNTSHAINTASTTIVSTVHDSNVNINQNSTGNGGNFGCLSQRLDSVGLDTVTLTMSWPFPVSVLTVQMMCTPDNIGDTLSLCVGPNTPVATLTANVNVDDTQLSVSDVTWLNSGYYVRLDDGVAVFESRIVSVDSETSSIFLETASTAAFASGTFVKRTVYYFKDLDLPGGITTVGNSTFTSSLIPANVVVQIDYTNNTATPKNFIGFVEYFY